MYSASKYLVHPIIDNLAIDNNRVSGGLPHSEIPGSKLILSSPGLIAEYHVLHRLLLPRHPPNALFALDLIQKEQGLRRYGAGSTRISIWSEVVHSRVSSERKHILVSVLDLDKIAARSGSEDHGRRPPLTRGASNSDV